MILPMVRSLDECERIIERGLASFVEVGEALMEIRDSRLYRDTHGTFEDYCRARWHISRDYAYKQIRAAKVAQDNVDRGLQAPKTEREARELAVASHKKEVPVQEAEIINEPVLTQRQREIANANKERFEGGVGSVRGYCHGLSEIKVSLLLPVSNEEEVDRWRAEIEKVIWMLRRITKELKEVRHEKDA